MTIGLSELMEQALATVEAIGVEDAKNMVDDAGIRFVDVRDLHELEANGKIVGAIHASRGMLEFLIDPHSPYHNKAFNPSDDSTKQYIVYCMSGGRSALAAARMKEMGYRNVCHLNGGFKSWRDSGGAIEQHEE